MKPRAKRAMAVVLALVALAQPVSPMWIGFWKNSDCPFSMERLESKSSDILEV